MISSKTSFLLHGNMGSLKKNNNKAASCPSLRLVEDFISFGIKQTCIVLISSICQLGIEALNPNLWRVTFCKIMKD